MAQKIYPSMNNFKIICTNCLMITAFCSLFIQVTPNDKISKCNEAMNKAFGKNKSLLFCIKKSIKSHSTKITLDEDVEKYYSTFERKVLITSVVLPTTYCTEEAEKLVYDPAQVVYFDVFKNNFRTDCIDKLKKFGETREAVLKAALYDHRQGKEINMLEYVHPRKSTQFYYLTHVSDNIELDPNLEEYDNPSEWCQKRYTGESSQQE